VAQDVAAYDRWLASWWDSGRPVYLLGGPAVLQVGADGYRVPDELWKGLLGRLGMATAGANEFPSHISALPGSHAGFECGFEPPPHYAPYTSTDTKNQVFFSERGDSKAIVNLGVVAPRGAFAASYDCIFETSPLTFALRWRVDPFWLFSRLTRPGEPALDTTTLNGRRLFYAHIDGDGFSNKARMQGNAFASEVVRDQVLKHTWLPTTASVIAREMVGHPALEAIARSIFRLPNVHAASHTFSHPFDWEKGIVPRLGTTSDASDAAMDEPHTHLEPTHEIDESIRYVQNLLPANRKVEALLWSGAANPPAAYLARTVAMGVTNLNGGGTVLDPRFPSYANLMPPASRTGAYWQIFASCGNENVFTNLWSGPFDGQLKALALFRFAESPRRMLPVNLYYHFYSGERVASLKTLQRLYHWAESQPLCHVTVASYCRVVEGYLGARLAEVAPGEWQVSGAGECRTLRFDNEEGGIDLKRSVGVAGFNHAHGSLYVHLSAQDARVVLSQVPPAGPYLESASARLASWKTGSRRLSATFLGEAPVTLSLAGFVAGQKVVINGDFIGSPKANKGGRLELAAPAGKETLEVSW
jgi:hypothetical protein